MPQADTQSRRGRASRCRVDMDVSMDAPKGRRVQMDWAWELAAENSRGAARIRGGNQQAECFAVHRSFQPPLGSEPRRLQRIAYNASGESASALELAISS